MLSNRTKGVLAITTSAFGFALMALFVRLCDDYGEQVSSFQKSFFRNFVALMIAAVVFVRGMAASPGATVASLRGMKCRNWLVLLLRAVVGTVGIFANFYALSHITIAEGQTLNKTAPFFTVLFAWMFLGEKAGVKQVISLVIAFIGVLLIAKPGFAGEAAFPLAIGLIGGMGAGAAYACVRYLRQHAVPSTFIVLFFSAFSCLASIPFMLAGFDPMTWRQVLILIGAGGGAAIGQFGVTMAYGFAAPKEIAVYDYSNILFTAALGFIFFSQIPDILSLVGFAAIIYAAFRMFR